jgi:signal transduction histidine kinase
MTDASPIDQPALAGELTHALMGELVHRDRPSPVVLGILDIAAARAVATPHAGVEAEADLMELLLPFAADVLAELALDSPWEDGVDGLIEDLAAALGRDADVVAVELHGRACRNSNLVALAPETALAVQLRLAKALGRIEQVSLWTRGSLGGINCVAHAGDTPPPKRPPALVRRAVARARGPAVSARGAMACPVVSWQQTVGALFVRMGPASRPVAATILTSAADALSPLLERHALLERNAQKEQALVAATERRLARLGFDLHDGPIQHVIALAGDLRAFRSDLAASAGAGDVPRLLDSIDTFEERLHGLDSDLRELCESLDAPAIAGRSLEFTLETEATAFTNQTGIRADVTISGRMDGLSASQRIALVRFIQEALNNVREHSGATQVQIKLGVQRGLVSAAVSDNGDGFSVEPTLLRVARAGRFGLVGMSERARLLGGRFDIRSEPGGPTTVSIALPPWQPSTKRPGLAEPLVAGG